ncbi:hypothetical protein HIM_10140 [Hirsutella minnesotensis 3608]|uniref:C2H2-type domain-containing protein n=1 Tax=Hirsutella minnesotensis 3608 TaxID=1043627 RepID=A0A0F7ZRZ4_9HYPO|nr:hypothetical protein HIM_10140 [Hirsutella minnesotensis 3608]
MQTVDELSHVVEEHRMLICRVCDSGVRPGGGIERHFRGHEVKGQLLADLTNYYGPMELDNLETGHQPSDGSAPITGLPVLRGYCCSACRFLTTSEKSAQQHWRSVQHSSCGAKYDAVRLQTWLRGKFARYWAVEEEAGDPPGKTGDSALDAMIAECEAELEADDAARVRKGDKEEGLDRDSTWVKRMAWVRHFGPRDKLEIFEAATWVYVRDSGSRQGLRHRRGGGQGRGAARSARAEFRPRNRAILFATGKRPHRNVTAAGKHIDDRAGRQAVRTQGQGGVHGEIPLRRTPVFGILRPSVQAGGEEALERWAVQFTEEQWGLLGDVVGELDRDSFDSTQDSGFFSERDGDDGEDSDDDTDNETDDGAIEPTGCSVDTMLDWAVYRFLVSSIRQNVGGNVYANPLLAFCAALGIRKQPLGYAGPHLYTGLLAAIMWWARLVFLEAMFEKQPREADTIGQIATYPYTPSGSKPRKRGSRTILRISRAQKVFPNFSNEYPRLVIVV